ncbi:MAG: DUF434 domain-containing protein [Planctomycetota bacterium]
MPDHRRHRGPAPEDARAFRAEKLPELRAAVSDLSWLLGRDYPDTASLELVGNRYRLTKRQRQAVSSVAAAEETVRARSSRRCTIQASSFSRLTIDGHNILTTLEAALSGGVVLPTRDGTHRDLASVHGTYRQVSETVPALELLGQHTKAAGLERCDWLLDRPVSNSGRLKETILRVASENGWTWTVELVQDPDPILAASQKLIATADRVILDRCGPWVDLIGEVLPDIPEAWIVDLR